MAAHAQAGQIPHVPTVPTNPGPPAIVQPLDCDGTTGSHGCGAGVPLPKWRSRLGLLPLLTKRPVAACHDRA
jgi:hypothetical protein